MKYTIIESHDKYQMQDNVENKLKEGYMLQGSPCIVAVGDMILYAQAMVKDRRIKIRMN